MEGGGVEGAEIDVEDEDKVDVEDESEEAIELGRHSGYTPGKRQKN